MDVSLLLSNDAHQPIVVGRIFFYDEEFRITRPECKRFQKFTEQQQAELNRVWTRTAYPNYREREILAQKLGTSVRKIQIWFQNKRARSNVMTSVAINQ
ncbi:hypothetical protein PROFUN_02167 [Planoprotostelium fungivorum]|uniref:Homeobox domain-containing protein n=1 Tax=Planoprotostelium fungivorum TaxID=1890364 RepID=A0A2P6NZA5_9EUKA|nr:hypothetical protein PROFUN_02167 [Planoprotostelium fungivorum]